MCKNSYDGTKIPDILQELLHYTPPCVKLIPSDKGVSLFHPNQPVKRSTITARVRLPLSFLIVGGCYLCGKFVSTKTQI